MLYRYGTFIHRRARLVLIISALALIAAAVVGVGAFGKLKGGGFDDPAADSTRAQQLVDERFGGDSNLVLLVHAKSGTVDDATVAQSGRALTDALSGEPNVRNVASYWSLQVPALKSTDGADAMVLAHIDGDDTQMRDRAEVLIDKYATDRGPVTVQAGGQAAVTVDVNGQVASSLAVAEGIAVPLTLILLILVFGSVVSAVLPLII